MQTTYLEWCKCYSMLNGIRYCKYQQTYWTMRHAKILERKFREKHFIHFWNSNTQTYTQKEMAVLYATKNCQMQENFT